MYAHHFFMLSQLLEKLHFEIAKSPNSIPADSTDLYAISDNNDRLELDNPIFCVSASFNRLADGERDRLIGLLELTNQICKEVNIFVSNDINNIMAHISLPYPSRGKAISCIQQVSNRIIYEMNEQVLLHIEKSKAIYFRNVNLYNYEIQTKFPEIMGDLVNAGTSYAVGLYSGCIFYLMRVMEHCLPHFGRKIRLITNVVSAPWSEIMLNMHKHVEALPSGAEATESQNSRKQRFEIAVGSLEHVRLAWRNDVMLPKATYNEQEALQILISVKMFLENIAQLI